MSLEGGIGITSQSMILSAKIPAEVNATIIINEEENLCKGGDVLRNEQIFDNTS